MPMKCMAQTPAPKDKAPVPKAMRASPNWLLRRAMPANCKAMADASMATSTDSNTSQGSC